jgi:hypothetical protein
MELVQCNRCHLSIGIRLATGVWALTDLLIDGSLDKPSFETAKQTAMFELAQLRGELDLLPFRISCP